MCQLLFILLFALNGISYSLSYPSMTVKKWIPHTDFSSPSNWDKNRVPCTSDLVIFPPGLNMPVELKSMNLFRMERLVVQGIILPNQGSILMSSNGTVVLSGRRVDAYCPGGANRFKWTSLPRWLDYDNWERILYGEVQAPSEAVPHLERIPCVNDEVYFSAATPFSVQLPPVTVSVSLIHFNNTNFRNKVWGRLWDNYLASREGQSQFISGDVDGKPTVSVTGGPICEDAMNEGVCGECGTSHLEDLVCVKSCPPPACFQPVKPIGFCCQVCGAYMLYAYKEGFKMRILFSDISKFLKDNSFDDDIQFYVSYTSGFVQVVLVERGEYQEMVESVATQLNDFILEVQKNHLKSRSEVMASGLAYVEISYASKFSWFMGLMFLALAIMGTIMLFYHREKQSWDWIKVEFPDMTAIRRRRFMFARFENRTGELELLQDETGVDAAEVTVSAFDNPMYSTDKGELEKMAENPVYSEIKARAESEEFALEDISEDDEKKDNEPTVY